MSHRTESRYDFGYIKPQKESPIPVTTGDRASNPQKLPTNTGRSASERRDRYSMPPVSAVGTLPLAARRTDPQAPDGHFQRSPSHVPCKSRRPGSRRLYAGHRLASNTGSRQAHPGNAGAPRFRCHLIWISTPQQRRPTPSHRPDPSASGTPSWSPPDPIKPSLFPDRSPRRSSANAAPGGLTPAPAEPTPEGHQASISRTAPPMKNRLLHQPPSMFVTHTCIQNFAPSVSWNHMPSTSRSPSSVTPSARYSARRWTVPPSRIFRTMQSRNTIG